MSAGRTGLGEAVDWYELHAHKKEKDSGVKKLICFISFVASSNCQRGEGLKRFKGLFSPFSSLRKKSQSSSNR